jgi:exonuclease 3'-5' domain-containing protein 1
VGNGKSLTFIALAYYFCQQYITTVRSNVGINLNRSSSSFSFTESTMALCSTPESLRAAVETLSGSSHVFLDCEGHTLGSVGGKLSLLSLGVVLDKDGERRLSTFLIDTLAFQGPNSHHLIPIFDILRSEVVFKVVFDGRMDASELLHGHGVHLKNVLDLQVADILSREQRGEGIEKRLRRLAEFLPEDEIRRNRTQYLQVQKLNGLESALEEHGVPSDGKGCEFRPIHCDIFLLSPWL